MLYHTRRIERVRKDLSQKNIDEFMNCVSPWISFPKDCDRNRRNRFFNFRFLFWLFLFQIFESDCSCSKTVSKAIALLASKRRKTPSPNSGSYCKAREKLSLDSIKKILHTLSKCSQDEIYKDDFWPDKIIKVIDGTTCTMPDTRANQESYPQLTTQKPGCGFPITRLVAIFSLSLGTILDWSNGPYVESEKSLFRSLIDTLKKDDVLLADRGFDAYADFNFLLQRKVNFVIRANESNRKNIQVLKRLSKTDHLVRLFKPASCSRGLDMETWRAMPESIVLRRITYFIQTKKSRTKKVAVLTDLVDSQKFQTNSFKELYYRRWRVELFLRDIKKSMGMDELSCKTPEMVEKELCMHIIGYNLIRNIMHKAALKKGEDSERISFKRSLNCFEEFLPFLEAAENDTESLEYLLDEMYSKIGSMKNPLRPNRREPRAKKRRPKPYQLLTEHRSVFREIPHRGKRQYS